MNELFAPPGNEWRAVSPSLARLRRTVLLVGAALAVTSCAVAATLGPLPAWWGIAAVVVLAALTCFAWVMVGRNARWWGYAERDEDLYIKHGALFRTLVVVPYGRMQYVDVQAGPLARAFDIAQVQLHTASPGTDAAIDGLPADEATRLRDQLASRGEARLAGL